MSSEHSDSDSDTRPRLELGMVLHLPDGFFTDEDTDESLPGESVSIVRAMYRKRGVDYVDVRILSTGEVMRLEHDDVAEQLTRS